MEKIKAFFVKKEKGFYLEAASALCLVLGLLFFLCLTSVSTEESEKPVLVITLTFVTILLAFIACYKDYFRVFSVAEFVLSAVTLFKLLEGRISYLAFYFSGDVVDTGLSPYLILALVFYLLSLLCSLFGVVFKQEKTDRAIFQIQDIRVLAVIVVAVAVIGSSVTLVNSGVFRVEEGGSKIDPPEEPIGNYKTPTLSENVWQGYDGEAYVSESVTGKEIAYQLTGQITINVGYDAPYNALVNLYADGETVVTVYGMSRVSTYYGYWTNENDENLWFCVAYYTMEGQTSICTIDYSYELTGKFDEITLNIALGFANGGQYIREVPVNGDETIPYSSVSEFLSACGKSDYKTPSVSEEVWADYTAEQYVSEDVTAKSIAYQFTADGLELSDGRFYYVILNLYTDGFVVLTQAYPADGRVLRYYGYWTNEDDAGIWFCVTQHAFISDLTNVKTIDYSYTIELNGEKTAFNSFDVSLALGFADGGQYIRTAAMDGSGDVIYTSESEYLIHAGIEIGEEKGPSEEPDDPVEETEVLFSFISDSENYLLDINKDGTYTFTFVTAGLVETGTWTWKNWTFTLIDANGTQTVAELNGETKALSLTFKSVAANGAVTRDFACEASVWGVAFNGSGEYIVE